MTSGNLLLMTAWVLPLALLIAAGSPLTIVKTSAVVSDPQGNLLPKRVPGSLVDYTVTITNPNGAVSDPFICNF